MLLPCLGQSWEKLYTLFRTERTKTTPCVAAHPRIGHIREYPACGGGGGDNFQIIPQVKVERTVKLFFCHILAELRKLLLSIGNSSQRNTRLVCKVSGSLRASDGQL